LNNRYLKAVIAFVLSRSEQASLHSKIADTENRTGALEVRLQMSDEKVKQLEEELEKAGVKIRVLEEERDLLTLVHERNRARVIAEATPGD